MPSDPFCEIALLCEQMDTSYAAVRRLAGHYKMRLGLVLLTQAIFAASSTATGDASSGDDGGFDDDVGLIAPSTHAKPPIGYNDGTRGGEGAPMSSRAPHNCLCGHDELWLGRSCVSTSTFQDVCEKVDGAPGHSDRVTEKNEGRCPRKYECYSTTTADVDGRFHAYCGFSQKGTTSKVKSGSIPASRELTFGQNEADAHKQVGRHRLSFSKVNAWGESAFRHQVSVHKPLAKAQLVAALVDAHGTMLPAGSFTLSTKVTGLRRSWCHWSHKRLLANVFESTRMSFACAAYKQFDLANNHEVVFSGHLVGHSRADLVFAFVGH